MNLGGLFRGRSRGALHFYRILQGLQTAFLVLISIFAALLAMVSLRSLSKISDPLSSPGLLDHLSLWMGVHERTAVVVWELDDWCSDVFVFIYQSQPSDGSFYITKEHRESLLPSLLADEERTPPNGSLLTLEEKIAELASVSKKYLPTMKYDLFSETNKQTRFPILIRLSSRAFSHPNKDAVLLSLNSYLRNESLFEYREDTSMGLLGTEEKRALQWFAINVLRKTFFQSEFSLSQTVLIFNVREYDVELTFAINSSALATFTSFSNVNFRTYKLRAYGHLIQLLTLKFSGMGLYSGRRGIYGLDHELKSMSLRSPCMNSIVNGTWDMGEGTLVTIQGLYPPEYEMVKEKDGPFAGKKVNKPVANIAQCKAKALDYLHRVMIPQKNQSETFKKVFRTLGRVRPVYIEGLYLEKAFEQGLTLPLRGGTIGCKALLESLKYACKSPNTEQPFSCTDMIYLTTLTQELLGLKSSSCSLNSPRNIFHGMNGDWPFAAAFYIYQNGL